MKSIDSYTIILIFELRNRLRSSFRSSALLLLDVFFSFAAIIGRNGHPTLFLLRCFMGFEILLFCTSLSSPPFVLVWVFLLAIRGFVFYKSLFIYVAWESILLPSYIKYFSYMNYSYFRPLTSCQQLLFILNGIFSLLSFHPFTYVLPYNSSTEGNVNNLNPHTLYPFLHQQYHSSDLHLTFFSFY